MNGRRKKKENPGFRNSEAFARANEGSTRANCSLGGSTRANIGLLKQTPFWKGSTRAEAETGGHFLISQRSDTSLITLYNPPYNPL